MKFYTEQLCSKFSALSVDYAFLRVSGPTDCGICADRSTYVGFISKVVCFLVVGLFVEVILLGIWLLFFCNLVD